MIYHFRAEVSDAEDERGSQPSELLAQLLEEAARGMRAGLESGEGRRTGAVSSFGYTYAGGDRTDFGEEFERTDRQPGGPDRLLEQLHVTITLDAGSSTSVEADGLELMSLTRVALENSVCFRSAYAGRLVGLVAESAGFAPPTPRRSAFRVPANDPRITP